MSVAHYWINELEAADHVVEWLLRHMPIRCGGAGDGQQGCRRSGGRRRGVENTRHVARLVRLGQYTSRASHQDRSEDAFGVRSKFSIETGGYNGASTVRYGSGSLWLSGASVRRITPPE
jgi:hypothetical protein